jgi:hypothetical protein
LEKFITCKSKMDIIHAFSQIIHLEYIDLIITSLLLIKKTWIWIKMEIKSYNKLLIRLRESITTWSHLSMIQKSNLKASWVQVNNMVQLFFNHLILILEITLHHLMFLINIKYVVYHLAKIIITWSLLRI